MNTCRHAFKCTYGQFLRQSREVQPYRNEECLHSCYKPVPHALRTEEPDLSVSGTFAIDRCSATIISTITGIHLFAIEVFRIHMTVICYVFRKIFV